MVQKDEEAGMSGKIRDKLVERKQEWAREGRLLTGAAADPATRLPPGQRLVKDWPVLDLGVHPDVPRETFRLEIGGLVENPVVLDWAAIMALPQQESVTDMHCVTQWSRYDNHWRGIATRTLIGLARPQPEVRHVLFHAHDGYTTNVTLEQFSGEDCALVHTWEGKPIERAHGGPLRVLIPRYYLWKSPKWVRRIEFSPVDRPGFWEVRGYNNHADPWLEERYS
jgi:DMSO/TMAO reductase YedYZ molybdopterin-dependent catalytic subunit